MGGKSGGLFTRATQMQPAQAFPQRMEGRSTRVFAGGAGAENAYRCPGSASGRRRPAGLGWADLLYAPR